MSSHNRAPCQICKAAESKYTCAQCTAVYCSIPCYKTHKTSSCRSQATGPSVSSLGQQLSQTEHNGPDASEQQRASLRTDTPIHESPGTLRPLTLLNWPYVPEESAYPDPLKRDDPKPLQLHQYEAIATSPIIRRTLALHSQLPALLRRIDALRGPAREAALEQALGVSSDPHSREAGTLGRGEEDQRALRQLAEAVEAAVRGGREGTLGLDWGD